MNRNRLLFAATSAFLAAGCGATAPVAPARTTPAPLAQPPRIIPMPESMTVGNGAPFAITKRTVIRVDNGNAEALQVAEALGALLRPPTDYPLPASLVPVGSPDVGPRGLPDAAHDSSNAIHLALASDRAALGDEGYELTVTSEAVRLIAFRPAGLFRGVQTLRQLLPAKVESEIGIDRPAWYVPAVTISDRPRFAWRGAMLDVARHFFTVKEVEQFIDIAALYKLNVVHLHLTDDQGWRIEIPSRPLLTKVGSLSQVGGGKGGFYTRDDWNEIVRYAQDRYITMVPEIEMPGHSYAGMSSYPNVACANRAPGSSYTGTDVGWSTFCVDSAATYVLLDDVIRDLAAMTPGDYIHIGGDEVATLKAADYARFIEHVQQIVTSHGKKMIGWEEITKAKLLPTTITQQWKSDSATAALQYHSKMIMSPAEKIYIDMKYNDSTELGLNWAANVEVRTAYDWDPATYMKGVPESEILGVEAPLWSETIQNISAAEYMTLPRLPAVAEIGWSPQAKRSWDDFRIRLASHATRWNQLGYNWYRSPQVPW